MRKAPMKQVFLALVFLAALGDCGEGPAALPLEAFVCGMDSKTYTVEDAAREGHEVRHRGKCDDPMYCESPEDCFVITRRQCACGSRVTVITNACPRSTA